MGIPAHLYWRHVLPGRGTPMYQTLLIVIQNDVFPKYQQNLCERNMNNIITLLTSLKATTETKLPGPWNSALQAILTKSRVPASPAVPPSISVEDRQSQLESKQGNAKSKISTPEGNHPGNDGSGARE